MRRVSKAGAVLLLAIFITTAIFADEPPPGTEPPQARIGPPTGLTSAGEAILAELLWVWLQVRIGPPTG